MEKKKFQSINELHLELFLKKYKPNNDSLVEKVRKVDSAILPPCSRGLLKKLKRSSYIIGLWRNCLNTNPQEQDVLSFGWRMKDGHYNIQWFDGDAAPKIVDVVHQWEGRLFKISIILKNCCQFYPIFQFLICTKAKFFQADNSQLKD